jgi:hypothetical protein
MITPLFIFSLPRTGSTLLQRMLSAQSEIATTSEPWLLLPLVTMTQEAPNLACYSHKVAAQGILDFASKLPGGVNSFRSHLANFVRGLYAAQSDQSARYFLDKTPRYYWIINDIAELFPEAKFIFLFRDPVQVIASIVDTWANGRFTQIEQYRADIQIGVPSLSLAAAAYANRSISVHYEDLVAAPETHLERICTFLQIQADTSVLQRIDRAQVPGRFGDAKGIMEYKTVTNASCLKWRSTLGSPYRKWVIQRMLTRIPREHRARHTVDGTDPLETLRSLATGPSTWTRVPWDIYDHGRSLRKQIAQVSRLRCQPTTLHH